MVYLSTREDDNLTNNQAGQQNKKPVEKTLIVQASLELLKEEGIHKLTMRKLAEKLDIKGASLYWHIQNKNELLGFMADEICKQIHFPDERLPWNEQITQLMSRFRNVLLNIRDSANILVETPPKTPYRLGLIRKLYALIEKAGFHKEDIFSIIWMLNNYVTYFVIEEYRLVHNKNGKIDLAPSMGNIFPFELSNHNMDKEFQFGLEVLIEGFKSKLNI